MIAISTDVLRRWVIVALSLAGAAVWPAAAWAAEVKTAATEDAQDLLFLGPLRPVWVRLHVTIDGKPFREIWRANVSKLFDDADADHDGAVRGAAADRSLNNPASKAPPDSVADLAERAAVFLGQDLGRARAGLEADAAKHGGSLTLAAFEEYFQQAAPPFSIAVGLGRTSAGQALFPLLDVDGDQQLTADELRDAEARLRIRDFDDNESLTRLELVDAPNSSLAAMSRAIAESASSPLLMAGPLAMIDAATSPEKTAEALLAEYDRDADGKLAISGKSAEIRPTASQLARFAVAPDEPLARAVLKKFCAGTPDLELKIELGKVSAASRRFGGTRTRSPAGGANAGPKLKQRPDGSLDVTLEDAHLFLRRNNRDPSKNADSGPTLQTFDADNNGYLDVKELAGVPNLAGAFEAIDTDGDGKIFAGELQSYTDHQNRAASVRLLLEVFDQGQELFDHLDENRDYRLSTRELHNAVETVKQIDANHDGRLSADEIPRQVVLEVSRNTPGAAQTERRSIRGGAERIRTASKRGPGWFQKMDRNDDGELSPREFLGPAEVFKRLDRDGNGVLDSKEAEQKD
jgi:Ca2+-binding EF-hand superfamily protein